MDYTKDYYAILGVTYLAEDIVIRAAYKALAQRYHPDRYSGPPDETNKKMADLNEAYSVLSNIEQRKQYDEYRQSHSQSEDNIFNESNDAPPGYDPLESDWEVAVDFYPDLKVIENDLRIIAWRLAYAYKAFLLDSKKFPERQRLADQFRQQFLQNYFGTNAEILRFALRLIQNKNKTALLKLNKAVRVLGTSLDAQKVIDHIMKEDKNNNMDTEKIETITERVRSLKDRSTKIPKDVLLKELEQRGIDFHKINKRNSDDFTPLMVAAMKGDEEVVEWLLIAGADTQLKSPFGRLAFQLADQKGYKFISLLIENYVKSL